MAKDISKLDDYRKLSTAELTGKLNELKTQYQTLRNEISMNKSRAVAKSHDLRHTIARVATILQEKMTLSQLENINGEA